MDTNKAVGNKKQVVVVIVLLLMLLLLLALNTISGSVAIPLKDIPQILFSRDLDQTADSIVWKIRLPRTLACLFLGGALALSGFLLQTFFANPIAGPYVLGISSGAKLTVALVMISLLNAGRSTGSAVLISAAFIGSMLTMGLVLLFSQRVQRSAALIVCGVMIGYICSAITDFVVTFADDASIVNLHNWSLGSFSGITWEDVQVMAVVVTLAAAITFLLSKPISAWQLGESYAHNAGVNIRLFRAALVLLSSILSACVTAFAGPVSFVGIAVPHIVKSLLKTSKPLIIIPVCFIGGAVFCLACDLIARTVFAPTEISISSVTAVFGAPIVIAIMVRKRRAE